MLAPGRPPYYTCLVARMAEAAWVPRTPAVQRALDFGVDVTLLLESLKYSPTERVRRAQRSLESALAFAAEAAASRERRPPRS